MSLSFEMPDSAGHVPAETTRHLLPPRAQLRDLVQSVSPQKNTEALPLLHRVLGPQPLSPSLDVDFRKAVPGWAQHLLPAADATEWSKEMLATWNRFVAEQRVLQVEARNQNRMGSRRVQSRVTQAWEAAYFTVFGKSSAEVLVQAHNGTLPSGPSHIAAVLAFDSALHALIGMERPDFELRGLHRQMDARTPVVGTKLITEAFEDLKQADPAVTEIDHIIRLSVLRYLLESARDNTLDGNPGKAELRLAGWLCSAVEFLLRLLARIDEHRTTMRPATPSIPAHATPDSVSVFRAVLAAL